MTINVGQVATSVVLAFITGAGGAYIAIKGQLLELDAKTRQIETEINDKTKDLVAQQQQLISEFSKFVKYDDPIALHTAPDIQGEAEVYIGVANGGVGVVNTGLNGVARTHALHDERFVIKRHPFPAEK